MSPYSKIKELITQVEGELAQKKAKTQIASDHRSGAPSKTASQEHNVPGTKQSNELFAGILSNKESKS